MFAPRALSIQIAALATVLAGVLGLAIAALLANLRFPGRDLVDVLVTAPIVLPPTVLGYYVLVTFGGRRSGMGHAIEATFGSPIEITRAGAVLAAKVGALTLVAKGGRAALDGVDPTLLRAARLLGAGPARAFVTVQLPLASRGVVAALMLGFARSLGDFGITLMVAGDIPGETQTASLAIYDAIQEHRDGAALALAGSLTWRSVSPFSTLSISSWRVAMRDESERALHVRLTLAWATRSPGPDGFSLEVAFDAPPGLTLLFGPSGAGKSTVLSAIAGFVRPGAGRVGLGGETWFDAERGIDVAPRTRGVAIVFQSLALFPHMTATQNVAYGVERSIDRAGRRAIADGWLERLRVAHLAARKPPTFSGGEAQRVALARALATKPRVVLLDEPFGALDARLRRDLSADVCTVLRELDVPVLLVTHQPDEVAAPGDRLVALDGGRISRLGPVSPCER